MISGTITVADYVAAIRLDHERGVTQILFWLVAALLIGTALIATGDRTPLGYILLFGGIGGVAVGLFLSRIHIPRLAAKRIAQYRELSEPLTCEWDSEKLGSRTATGQGQRPWTYYVKRKENDKVILLYMTDGLFQVIPKRWFATPAQLEEFQKCASVIRI